MVDRTLRIVFLGTPDFAVPSLKALAEAGYQVVGVFTQPDRPRDRGQRACSSPVKCTAVELGIPVFEFERIRRKEGVAALEALQPDLMVTAAFGQILSQKVLDIPRLGCINVHGSLLPKYRGPAPIQWAIINGETRTGITTMKTDAGIDTGDMLLQRETDIDPEENAGELFDRLAELGAQTLLETLDALQEGTLKQTPQDHEAATHFPMLTKEHGRIDWSRSAQEIHNQIRGVTPWPGAWTTLDGETVKIWKTRVSDAQIEPGHLVCSIKAGMGVGTGSGSLRIQEIQMPGKRRLSARDYLCGLSNSKLPVKFD